MLRRSSVICSSISAGSKRGSSTGGKDSDSRQQLSQLAGCTRIEAAVGAVCQARNRAEYVLDFPIAPLLEHEGRDAKTTKLAGVLAQGVRVLLHGIANED